MRTIVAGPGIPLRTPADRTGSGQAASKGIVTRGVYQLNGYRPDADYLFWWIADSADDLQDLYCRFLRTRLGRASDPTWSALGVHRPSEFNQAHVPSFLTGDEPRGYACFYPYARSLPNEARCWPSTVP